MIVTIIIRFVTRRFCDDSAFYDFSIVPLSNGVISVWIFLSVFMFCNRFPLLSKRVSENTIVQFFEKILLEFYFVNSLVLDGYWNVTQINCNLFIRIVLSLIITCVWALVIHNISKIIEKFIMRCNKKRVLS